MIDGDADEHAEILAVASELATRAGSLALAGRRSLPIGQALTHDTKSSDTDPVTEFDRNAEALIVAELRARRPDDAIIGEEGAAHTGTSGLAWHVDPIDGTANFLYDLPGWCTSIGVVDDRGPLVGAVYLPVTDELFTASRGAGSALNGRPIRVSAGTSLAHAMVGTGFNYVAEERRRQAARIPLLLARVRDIRRVGSAAGDLCAVAAGRLDAYFEEHLHSWDLMAGWLIAAEGGAIVTDFHHAPPSSTVVAATPGIHRALVDAINDIDAALLTESGA